MLSRPESRRDFDLFGGKSGVAGQGFRHHCAHPHKHQKHTFLTAEQIFAEVSLVGPIVAGNCGFGGKVVLRGQSSGGGGAGPPGAAEVSAARTLGAELHSRRGVAL